MGGYRSDLEAAHLRAQRLEARLDEIEEERATLERELAARPGDGMRAGPWILLAAVGVVAAFGVSALVAAGAEEEAAPIGSPTVEPAVEPEPELTSAMMSGDAVFYGQFWRARVESSPPSGPSVGTECLIELNPGLHNGAGRASVRCGARVLHQTAVSPPERADDSGFCGFRETGELECAPPASRLQENCWISTARHVASCQGNIHLYIHSSMQRPRPGQGAASTGGAAGLAGLAGLAGPEGGRDYLRTPIGPRGRPVAARNVAR